MKKVFVIAVLIALACFLLCGCTPKGSESGKTDSDVKLPTLNTELDGLADDSSVPEIVSQEQEATAPQMETEIEPGVESQTPSEEITDPFTVDDSSEEPTIVQVIESENNPDEETVSDIVIDGGDGFGIGGN